jgi:hypothetical protein
MGAIIIFPFCPLKFVKGTFQMEYDQRVIIKFFLKDRADARNIADRLQAQFRGHAYKLRTVQFWITEVELGCQGLHDEIRTGILPLDDLDAKILAISDKPGKDWSIGTCASPSDENGQNFDM